jgi:hypothetical protein
MLGGFGGSAFISMNIAWGDANGLAPRMGGSDDQSDANSLRVGGKNLGAALEALLPCRYSAKEAWFGALGVKATGEAMPSYCGQNASERLAG